MHLNIFDEWLKWEVLLLYFYKWKVYALLNYYAHKILQSQKQKSLSFLESFAPSLICICSVTARPEKLCLWINKKSTDCPTNFLFQGWFLRILFFKTGSKICYVCKCFWHSRLLANANSILEIVFSALPQRQTPRISAFFFGIFQGKRCFDFRATKDPDPSYVWHYDS